MANLKFEIEQMRLRAVVIAPIVSGSQYYLEADFKFSSDWDGYTKTVYFNNGNDDPYFIELVDDAITSDMNLSIPTGTYSIYLTGVLNTSIITTTQLTIAVVAQGITGTTPATDVPETLFDEVEDKIAELTVNGASSINKNILIDTDDVPATETNRYVPATVDEYPELYYLNANNEFVQVATGNSGSPNNLFLTGATNSLNTDYKLLSYTNQVTTETLSATVTSASDVLIQKFLFSSEIGITNISTGNWDFTSLVKVDKTIGVTRLKMIFIKVSNTGVETELFSFYTNEIDTTSYAGVKSESNQPSFTVLATDRIGVKIYATTTSVSNIIVSMQIGDGSASYINLPLPLRHNQLRGLNDDAEYQHINSTDRANLDNLILEEVNAGTTMTITMDANKVYVWDELTTDTLAITLGTPISGINNEYEGHFTTGVTAPTMAAISGCVWKGGNPVLLPNKNYGFVISHGKGLIYYV